MISHAAKEGFDQLVRTGLRNGLVSADGQACRIEAADSLDKIKAKKVVILTVSSYLFRLITTIYFRDDAPTRAFFAPPGEDGEPSALSEQEFLDRIAECGNLCCGTLNRDLGRYFPHVGMSTPNIIDKDCMRYVDLLEGSLLRHYTLALSPELSLHASLCVTAYGSVDFRVDAVPEEDLSTGELEFF
jgi:hypothetical protein